MVSFFYNATAAMDRGSEQFVLKLLLKLKNSTAIIFISHRLQILHSFCNRICIMGNGTITHCGTHQSLLQQGNLYSKYWASPAGTKNAVAGDTPLH